MTDRESPNWYKDAFDEFPNFVDQLAKHDSIIADGFDFPDIDKSRSSQFKDEAILNNTFDEKAVRESLKDIYLNSSHKLIANNKDNVHFSRWEGTFSDWKHIEYTNMYEMTLPWDAFIYPMEREIFKASQFDHKWISIEELSNNWDVFKWMIMVFIGRKVASNFEIFIEEQFVKIRIKAPQNWYDANLPIYIWKFDTTFQKRVKITYRELAEHYRWQYPFEHLDDSSINLVKKLMVTFNIDPINDKDNEIAATLGENVEFLLLDDKNKTLDLGKSHQANIDYIRARQDRSIWMTICAPKFLHEYPILLPTDIIYRPYIPSIEAIDVLKQNLPKRVKSDGEYTESKLTTPIDGDKVRQIYIDRFDYKTDDYDGWTNVPRPIVLSDAFVNTKEPYEATRTQIATLKAELIEFINITDDYKRIIRNDTNRTQAEWANYIINISERTKRVKAEYSHYYDSRSCPHPFAIDNAFEIVESYTAEMNNVGPNDVKSIGDNWLNAVSDIRRHCFAMIERFDIAYTVNAVPDKRLWYENNEFIGEQRFLRPVDESNFIIFEYKDQRWLPTDIKVTRHFPDVYTLSYPDGSIPAPNTILKAFFFYSDTMNVREISKTPDEIIPEYDEMLSKYNNYRADYKNIFMEKFYWMAIQSLYKGLLVTGSKWEVVEYICDNMSYRRFNELFLTTMDPYFKLGLATYLKGANTEFPFDDAIDKLNEAMSSKMELEETDEDGVAHRTKWAEFSKTENYERYLAHQWVPSYFDIVEKIMDDYDFSSRLTLRPPLTFDPRQLAVNLSNSEIAIKSVSDEILEELRSTITYIDTPDDHYNLNTDAIGKFEKSFAGILAGIKRMKEYVQQLDPETYNIEQLNRFRQWVDGYEGAVGSLHNLRTSVYDDIKSHDKVTDKIDIAKSIGSMILSETYGGGTLTSVLLENITDLIFSHNELNPDKLRQYIHTESEDTISENIMQVMYIDGLPWSTEIMDMRTTIRGTVNQIASLFTEGNIWDDDAIAHYDSMVNSLYKKVEEINRAIRVYCEKHNLDYYTDEFEGAFETAMDICKEYVDASVTYQERLTKYRESYNAIIDSRKNLTDLNPTENDYDFISKIENLLTSIDREMYSMWKPINSTLIDSSLMDIMSNVSAWLDALETEKAIFESMMKISSQGSYENSMKSFVPMMSALSAMIEEFNSKRVIDMNIPSYSKIFTPKAVSISTPGFNYSANDIAFVPDLGSIDIKGPQSIEIGEFYNKSFRNPQKEIAHNTISPGTGMGLRIICEDVEVDELVDDHLLDNEIERISSICKSIDYNAMNVNSYNNPSARHIVIVIERCIAKVNEIELLYGENITPESKEIIMGKTNENNIIKRLTEIKPKLSTFINSREKCDVRSIINAYNNLITVFWTTANKNEWPGAQILYDSSSRIYDDLMKFFGYGNSWSSTAKLRDVLNDIQSSIVEYYDFLDLDPANNSDDSSKVLELVNVLRKSVLQADAAISTSLSQGETMMAITAMIKESLDLLESGLSRDDWYKIDTINLSNTGHDFMIGDLVKLVGPVEKYIFRVTGIDHGAVTMVEPLMDYALQEKLWGYYETETLYGDGEGLSINLTSLQVVITPEKNEQKPAVFTALPRVISADGQLVDFKADLGFRKSLVQFGDNDLVSFKFENIHDLDMKYEVFVGGRQITNFIQRHEIIKNTLLPNKVDTIYINANLIDDLRNSSIFITEDNYFVYGINGAIINHPGAGFYKGQEIFLNAGDHCLRLRVGELDGTPHKGINEIDLVSIQSSYERQDPGGTRFETIPSDMDNIDDEFHVNDYDKLTSAGNEKSVLISKDDEKYIEKRYPTVNGYEPESDHRNDTFTHPDVNQDHTMKVKEGIAPIIENIDVIDCVSNNSGTRKIIINENGDTKQLPSTNSNSDIYYLGDYDISQITKIVVRVCMPEYSKYDNYYTPSVHFGYTDVNNGDIIDLNYISYWSQTAIRTANNRVGTIAGKTEYVVSGVDKSDDYIGAIYTITPDEVSVDSKSYSIFPGGTATVDNAASKPIKPINGTKHLFMYASAQWCRAVFDYVKIYRTSDNPEYTWHHGDPDFKWSQGHRIDNSVTGDKADKWEGIQDTEEIINGVTDDNVRIPPGQLVKGEYQLIARARFHISDKPILDNEIAFEVPTLSMRPRFPNEWPTVEVTDDDGKTIEQSIGTIGKYVAVTNDESHDGHRWVYRVTELSATGFFRYDDGYIADARWSKVEIDWMNSDWHTDHPCLREQYQMIPYREIISWYTGVELPILTNKRLASGLDLGVSKANDSTILTVDADGRYNPNLDYIAKVKNFTTHIHNMTTDDIAVYNYTKKEWEDITDETRWKLTVHADQGFTLEYLKEDNYSYDMKIYLIKKPDSQKRAQELVNPANIDIVTSIIDEVDTPADIIGVETGRNLRIRKLFPYRQIVSQLLSNEASYSVLNESTTSPSKIGGGIVELADQLKGTTIPNGTSLSSPMEVIVPGTIKIGAVNGKVFIFKKAKYMHYRNEIHLQDLKLKNMTTDQFENILDTNRWEVLFKYDDHVSYDISEVTTDGTTTWQVVDNRGNLLKSFNDENAARKWIDEPRLHTEKRINVDNIAIYQPGVSFITGDVWGYDEKHALNIFGRVEANINGEVTKFTPTHLPETPKDGTYEFSIYQRNYQGSVTSAKIGIIFSSEVAEVEYDGYIHGVTNPMAVLPDEVRLIPKFDIPGLTHFEARVELTQREYSSISDKWELNHTLTVKDYQCPENRWYVLVNGYRYPVINCSTGNKTLAVQEFEGGTTVTFRNILKPHERIEYRTLPYPVRSVYTRRNIPKHGYLNMAGILSKPLSKTYYEFWVNGKLLDDEVSIVSPTKLFLHGLASLKNLEILEINRDSHEYFSDAFLKVSEKDNRPYPEYDLSTYLDAALEGKRLGKAFDAYTEEEQALLLEPVWKQVARDHPEYKRYPENVDVDPDILERINTYEDLPLPETLPPETYPLMILNAPKLEGVEVTQHNMHWGDFKWVPISDQTLIDMMNEEWKEEIANDPYLHQHSIISDDVWYGRLVTMFDFNGNITHDPSEMLYYVADDKMLVIDNVIKEIRVVDMHPNINLDI